MDTACPSMANRRLHREKHQDTARGRRERRSQKQVNCSPIIPEWVDLKLAVSEHRLVIDLDFHREAIYRGNRTN